MAAPPAPRRQIPPELSDPAMADKLGRMLGALTRALMDMPVGEVEAAIEGRAPTAADRARRGPRRDWRPGAPSASVEAAGRRSRAARCRR